MFEVIIKSKDDVLLALNYTRKLLKENEFSKVNEQQVLVCVSELTNNILKHSGVHGIFKCYIDDLGIHIIVSDKGKGIANICDLLEGNVKPLTKGLGLGLKGASRLMDEFIIETNPNKGVYIIALKRK